MMDQQNDNPINLNHVLEKMCHLTAVENLGTESAAKKAYF